MYRVPRRRAKQRDEEQRLDQRVGRRYSAGAFHELCNHNRLRRRQRGRNVASTPCKVVIC